MLSLKKVPLKRVSRHLRVRTRRRRRRRRKRRRRLRAPRGGREGDQGQGRTTTSRWVLYTAIYCFLSSPPGSVYSRREQLKNCIKRTYFSYVSSVCLWLVYRIVSYRIVSYRIVSYRIVSYRIVSYRIVSYRIVSYRIVSYRIVQFGVQSCPSLELMSPLQVTHLPPVWDLLLPLA